MPAEVIFGAGKAGAAEHRLVDADQSVECHRPAESLCRKAYPGEGEALVIRILIAAGTAFISVAALTASEKAQAWGKFGHLTVCDLAYRNLTPVSKQELKSLMRGGFTVRARGETQARHYTSFNLGCLEEDEMPRRNKNDHFINLTRSTPAITGEACPPDVASGQCILSGIRRDLAILQDKTKPRTDRIFALFAIGHWIGDIHQPLHVSFADDRGGNGIDAKVTGGCGAFGYYAKELHGVWDNCILHKGTFGRVRQRADFKTSWSRWTVTYRAVDTLQANTSLAKEQEIVAGEPWQWAQESYQIATRPEVRYCIRVGDSCNYKQDAERLRSNMTKRFEQLDQPYLQRYDRLVEDRIRYAGFRLAHLLNQALDPGYNGPIKNSEQPE